MSHSTAVDCCIKGKYIYSFEILKLTFKELYQDMFLWVIHKALHTHILVYDSFKIY